MAQIPHKLHFVCSDMVLTQDLARYYARWMAHAKFYRVYIWARTMEEPLMIAPLLAAIRKEFSIDAQARVKVTRRTAFSNNYEFEFATHFCPMVTVCEHIPLRSLLAKNAAVTELERWENPVAMRRLLRLGALYLEGGIALEQCVQPDGDILPLGIHPPDEVLFYMLPGSDPPHATDTIMASVPRSEKMTQLITLLEQKYADELHITTLPSTKQVTGSTRLGRARLLHLGTLRSKVDSLLQRGIRSRRQEREYHKAMDDMLSFQLRRNTLRSGIVVINEWLREIRGLRVGSEEFRGILAERREDVARTNVNRAREWERYRRRRAMQQTLEEEWRDPNWFDQLETIDPYPEEYKDLTVDERVESTWGYVPSPTEPSPLLRQVMPHDYMGILCEELNQYSFEKVMGLGIGSVRIADTADSRGPESEEFIVL